MKHHTLAGAWIYPDGTCRKLHNGISHSSIFSELNLKQQLLSKAAKVDWSTQEIQSKDNVDLSIIAAKLGFIRIIWFKDQFGIDFFSKISKLQFFAIDKLIQASMAQIFTAYEINKKKSTMFYSKAEFKNFIMDNTEF